MTIRYVPNDPLAVDVVPAREQPPRPDPADGQAAFSYPAPVPEAVYAADTVEFRFWQCREAALAAREAWGALAPLPAVWQNGDRLLPLKHESEAGLGARYNRAEVACFASETAARKTYAAASTDAVAHEVGHALLDAVRPELWMSPFPETAAFHEAFGDCTALLVGLFDAPSRQALVEGGQLRAANFLEALAEDVADGVRIEHGANDPQSVPRHALNTLQWDLSVNLPPFGLPAALTAEAHSFGRVFTGCFYDTVCNIFAAGPNQDEQGLLTAAQTAGRLLIAGARAAPEVLRFFQAVGRAMIMADEAASGGAHRLAIRDAFGAHNVAIGSTVMLAPTAALLGAAPKVNTETGTAALSAAVRRDLLERIGARGGRLSVTGQTLGGRTVAKAVHHRNVPLGKLHRRLKGAVVPAAEPVLVGAGAERAVVLGHLPDPRSTADEVHHFVTTLLKHDCLGTAGPGRKGKAKTPKGSLAPTHALQKRGGKMVLNRISFA
jgi:hypothetical protein